jgi:PAS domain-containing protein
MELSWQNALSLVATAAVAWRTWFEYRKSVADRAKTRVDQQMSMLGLNEKLEGTLVTLASQNETDRETIARLRAERDALKDELALWKKYGPLEFAAEILSELESVESLLDDLICPVIVTTSADGGTFIFVNDSFADSLAMSKGEILERGWRDIIHPMYLDETKAAEAEAWSTGVEIVNDWVRGDGTIVKLRWSSTRYFRRRGADPGHKIAIARARVVPIRGSHLGPLLRTEKGAGQGRLSPAGEGIGSSRNAAWKDRDED